MQTSITTPSSEPTPFEVEKYSLFQLSWLDRLRVLWGCPVRVRLKVALPKDPKVFKHDLTLDCKPIGGDFS